MANDKTYFYEPTIRQYGAYYDMYGYNSIVKLKGFDFWFRGRSEMLVLNSKNELFLELDPEKVYKIPGGSLKKNETHQEAAERETMEESRILVDNVIEVLSYAELREPSKWMIENIPEQYIWRGYYQKVFISQFKQKYIGHIDEIDVDSQAENGRFYNIKKVWEILKEPHKIALKNYLQS